MEDYSTEMLAEQPWEETLEFLTSDMDPESIDICVLSDRYRTYIRELQRNNLQVSARAIRVLAALLNMKAQTLRLEDEEQEPEEENPMDFEEEELIEEEEFVEEDEEPDLRVGPELEMPVKQKPKRRVQLDELKNSLRDDMEVKERREEREMQRQEMDQQFEVEEKDLQSKLNDLYGRIRNFVSSPSENVDFSRIIENEDSQEKMENDEKVDLIQEEFLGDLMVKPKKDEVAN